MPTATLEIDRLDVLYVEAARCEVALENDTTEALTRLNPDNAQSLPSIEISPLAGGEPVVCAPEKLHGALEIPDDLPSGEVWARTIRVPDWARFPGPGWYELSARFTWSGGEARSEPARLLVRPAHPRAVTLAPIRGVACGLTLGAWVQGAQREAGPFELWLTSFVTSGEPRVRPSVRLSALERTVTPVLSVPPAVTPNVQWIAWVDGGQLHAVRHSAGVVTAEPPAPLPGPACSIVPPLLLDPDREDVAVPAVSVLLHEPGGDGSGRLHVLRLAEGGAASTSLLTIDLELDPLLWGCSAHLSDHVRHTLLLTPRAGGGCALKRIFWPARDPLEEAVEELSAWELGYLAADLLLTAGDVVRGVVLGEVLGEREPEAPRRWAMQGWMIADDGMFEEAGRVPIAWPEERPIAAAVVRVSARGAACALLRAEGDPWWRFCGSDGAVGEPMFELGTPADVLFRDGDDPILLHAPSGRGFEFVRGARVRES